MESIHANLLGLAAFLCSPAPLWGFPFPKVCGGGGGQNYSRVDAKNLMSSPFGLWFLAAAVSPCLFRLVTKRQMF